MNTGLISLIALFILMVFGVVNINAQMKTIVAFGDSLTAPRKNVVTYSDFIQQEFEKKSLGVKVINSGVGGNTTEMAKKRFEKDVLAYKPDLVIIQFGGNDSAIDVWKNPPAASPRVDIDAYEKNIRDFIQVLKKQNTKIILLTSTPSRWTDKLKEMYGKPPYLPNEEDGFNVIRKKYVQKIKDIAKKEKVILVDSDKAYYEYHKVKGQKMDDLYLDGLHPTTDGQKIIANLLLKEIKKLKFGL